MSEYKFKRVDKNCYADLESLHRNAFKENPLNGYYRNKMDTSYLNVSHLGYMAYSADGKPAAFYGVYPCMMEYKGKHYLAAQSGDTMTDPAHAGKGLFTTLAKMTYELAKLEGVEFIFGFPNKNSYPGFAKKLNWQFSTNMRDYQLRIITLPFAALAKKVSLFSPFYSIYVRFVIFFFKSDKSFQPNSAIDNNFGGLYRSINFFNYKSANKNFLLQISGRTIWIKIDGGLLVGDIERGAPSETDKIISLLKKVAALLGCTKILFSVGKGTYWDLMLRDKLACEEKTYVGYLDLSSGLPLENFRYMMADFDTF